IFPFECELLPPPHLIWPFLIIMGEFFLHEPISIRDESVWDYAKEGERRIDPTRKGSWWADRKADLKKTINVPRCIRGEETVPIDDLPDHPRKGSMSTQKM